MGVRGWDLILKAPKYSPFSFAPQLGIISDGEPEILEIHEKRDTQERTILNETSE